MMSNEPLDWPETSAAQELRNLVKFLDDKFPNWEIFSKARGRVKVRDIIERGAEKLEEYEK